MSEVKKRWEWLDKEDLIKRILSREFGRFLQYYANAPEIESTSASDKGEAGGRRQRNKSHQAEEGYVRLFLNVGKIDGMYAREIIGLINKNVQGDKVAVGRIDLMKSFSFIEVKQEDLNRVLKALKHGVTVKGRSVVCDISTDEPKATTTHAPRGEKKATARKEKPTRQKEKKTTPVERKETKPSREERGYTAPRGKKFKKEDWMQFLNPDKPQKKHELKGEMPDFSEEGWARRKPKKKK
jgi:ATP-dependent RNA helicase DeaD